MRNRTHSPIYPELAAALETIKRKCRSRGNLSDLTVEEQCSILDDLSTFPLGRHILLTGGANGIWTDYMISPQAYFGKSDLFHQPLSLIECFLLFHSPVVLAQRELFVFLQKTAQKHIAEGKVFASVPCGMMRDLLTLNFSSVKDIQLVGIDIDPVSITQAKKLASEVKIKNVSFFERDAWDLGCKSEFDFISSVGLNMYEPNKDKVVELYNQFYLALNSSSREKGFFEENGGIEHGSSFKRQGHPSRF